MLLLRLPVEALSLQIYRHTWQGHWAGAARHMQSGTLCPSLLSQGFDQASPVQLNGDCASKVLGAPGEMNECCPKLSGHFPGP
jgi:hypothetical protein